MDPQVTSFIRSILGMAAGIVIAHGFANATTWEYDIGFVLSLVTFGWSAIHHGMTSDIFGGLFRNAVTAVGGYFVFKGWAVQGSVDEALTVTMMLVPMFWGVAQKGFAATVAVAQAQTAAVSSVAIAAGVAPATVKAAASVAGQVAASAPASK